MNKIFQDLSGDISELLLFLDKNNPEVLNESILSSDMENSFFINFASKIKNDYESLTTIYNINTKFGYKFKNRLNKKLVEVNDLIKVITSNYHENFTVERLKEISREDVIKLSIEHNLLLSSFSNNKVNLINYLSNFKELWQDEKINKIIEDNHLKNVNLNELFYQNTNKDNLESYREQCRKLLNKELNYIDKGNLESSNKRITDFITEMNSKENVFSDEFKEEVIGLSLQSPFSKITNSIIKILYNEKLSTYKPKKPLWTQFENLKNKDILYQFLDNFNYNDYWDDENKIRHYKIDYLEKALNKMDVSLKEKGYEKDNKTKRDVAITNIILPKIKDYGSNDFDGKFGFIREILKKKSIFKGQIKFYLTEDKNKIREVLDKTLFLKENNEYIVLNKISFHIKEMIGLEKVLESNILTNDEIIEITKRYLSFSFDEKILGILKEKFIEHKLVMDLEPIKENKAQMWCPNKNFFEELETIVSYNSMHNKFENVASNKIKAKKI